MLGGGVMNWEFHIVPLFKKKKCKQCSPIANHPCKESGFLQQSELQVKVKRAYKLFSLNQAMVHEIHIARLAETVAEFVYEYWRWSRWGFPWSHLIITWFSSWHWITGNSTACTSTYAKRAGPPAVVIFWPETSTPHHQLTSWLQENEGGDMLGLTHHI